MAEAESTREVLAADRRLLGNAWFTLPALAILVALALVGYVLGERRLIEAPANQELLVADADLDFGEVWATRDFHWTLPIHNPTSTPIHISRITTTCRCTAVSVDAVTVPAGATIPIELTLDLLADNAPGLADTREFAVRVLPVVTGGIYMPDGWRVHGRVRQPVSLSATGFHFGDTLVYGQSYPSATVEARFHFPVEELSATCEAWFGDVAVKADSAQTGLYHVTLTPRADLEKGRYAEEVRLRPRPVPPGVDPEIRLPILAHVVDPVHAYPPAVQFGAVVVGQTDERTACVSSRGGDAVRVESCQSSSMDIDVTPIGEPVEGQQELRISLRATALGRQSAEARLVVRRAGQDEAVEVVLPIHYHGISIDQNQ
jgi:hypothetical protein